MLPWSDTTYGQIKNGVLVLSGYSIGVREVDGCLIIKDGLKWRSEIEHKFARATCPISRLIVVRPDGYITFAAVRWLHETGVALVHLNGSGEPTMISVSQRNTPSPLRRIQAGLTAESVLGRSIVYSLIRAKISGEIENLRYFGFNDEAEVATGYAVNLRADMPLLDMQGIEGIISVIYWAAFANQPLQFAKKDRVADHWAVFGNRRSTLSQTARHAISPGNALLNYFLGVLASEISIALQVIGLDPSLGIMHADKEDRASLTYDLIEPARPILSRYFFCWLRSITFNKRDFQEDKTGLIRISHPLNSHLASSAGLWRGLADQLAQWLVQRLSTPEALIRHEKLSHEPRLTFVDHRAEAGRRADRWSLGNVVQRPIPTTCMNCGKALSGGRHRKFCSLECTRAFHGSASVEAGLAAIRRRREAGLKAKPRPPAVAPEGVLTIAEWRRQPGWSTERDADMRTWYMATLSPALRKLRPRDIRAATGFAATASISIRRGVGPHAMRLHPRWFRALAMVAGVEYPW